MAPEATTAVVEVRLPVNVVVPALKLVEVRPVWVPLRVLLSAPAAKMSVSKFETAPPSRLIPVLLMLSVSASCASVERPKSGACEVESVIAYAEVDGGASRCAPRREGHSISAHRGRDSTTTHGAHNGDPIRRCGSRIAAGASGLDSAAPLAAGDRAPGSDDNSRPGSCPCENAGSGTRRGRRDRDTRRSTAIIESNDAARSAHDCAASGDIDVASRGAIAETCRNAGGRISSSDSGGGDADAACLGARVADRDAMVASHDCATACVDSDTGAGTIGERIYPAIVATDAGDSAKFGHVTNVDIAAGASASIGEDAVPCGALDSAGFSDALYRDVAAARDSLDTAPAGAEHRVSTANSNRAARRVCADSVSSLSGDRGSSDNDSAVAGMSSGNASGSSRDHSGGDDADRTRACPSGSGIHDRDSSGSA